MKIYEIVIHEGKMSYEQSHHILAGNFDEAITQAHKMLARIMKENCEDAYIESICEEFELEVVK